MIIPNNLEIKSGDIRAKGNTVVAIDERGREVYLQEVKPQIAWGQTPKEFSSEACAKLLAEEIQMIYERFECIRS